MQILGPTPDPPYPNLQGWGQTIWELLSTPGDSDDTQVWEALLEGTENIPLAHYPWWWLSKGLNLISGSSTCFKTLRYFESISSWIYTHALEEEVTDAFHSWAHYAQNKALPGEAAPVYTYLEEQYWGSLGARRLILGYHGCPGVGKIHFCSHVARESRKDMGTWWEDPQMILSRNSQSIQFLAIKTAQARGHHFLSSAYCLNPI